MTFPAGKTTETISVPVLANSSTTGPKAFQLNLSSPSNAVLIPQQNSATCTIEPKSAAPAHAAVIAAPAAVTTGPRVPSSLAAAVAAVQTSSTSNKKQTTTAVDAVFATLMSTDRS